MKLNRILYDRFIEKARKVSIENVTIGLGYTAVTLSDGGMGLAGTWFAGKKPTSMNKDYVDFEGKPADELLAYIHDDRMVHRCMALALINAFNYPVAAKIPESPGNRFLLKTIGVARGTKVSMVGFFRPLVERIKAGSTDLDILDETLGLGERQSFYDRLSGRSDVLILTSTSILNNTTEDILQHTGKNVKTIMMGPSTPMVSDVFKHFRVHMLAGAVPVEKEKVLRAVRHGTGTPVIKNFCRQVYCTCP